MKQFINKFSKIVVKFKIHSFIGVYWLYNRFTFLHSNALFEFFIYMRLCPNNDYTINSI